MKHLKIIISILLLICLFHMPYGYYTLVRFIVMAAFAYMAMEYHKRKNDGLTVTFGALALLFQPFVKAALGRAVWNVVDVVVAVLLVVLFVKERKG